MTDKVNPFFYCQKLKIINQNQIYMKKTLSLIIIIIITCSIKAQDIMITKEGQKIEAKVEEVGLETIKYKKYNNQSGATYLILKSDIASIMYENGEVEVFSQQAQKQTKQEAKEFNYKNASNLYYSGIGLSVGGTIVLVGGVVCYCVGKYPMQNELMKNSGTALMIVGSFSIVSGIVCAVVGEFRMKNSSNISLFETNKYKLDMAIGGNVVGLKLKF
jgi:uncharacterized membrane protein YidH (DUF202 family)